MADTTTVEVETSAPEMEETNEPKISPPQAQASTVSDDEFDIHVCGRCRGSFTDLTKYIEHKKSRSCMKTTKDSKTSEPTRVVTLEMHPSVLNQTTAEENVDVDQVAITPLTQDSEGASEVPSGSSKVVVELLDPVDIEGGSGRKSPEVKHDHGYSRETDNKSNPKPTKRRKRKSSTPKTTRKPKVIIPAPPTQTIPIDSRFPPVISKDTITVHIPESQLVHLGGSASASGTSTTVRKAAATSVFVPIYLTNAHRSAFRCSKCPAEFRTKEEREEHASMHKKNFKCGDCNKRYFTADALEHHKQHESHTHKCDECGKVFHSQIYLKRHKTVHVEERNFPCEICNKAYTSDSNLKAHKRSVHCTEKKHKCDECGKAFARKDKLKRHQLIHIPYPNRPVFPCPFRSHTGCTSTFYREDKLKRHLFTHSKEKPYKCQQCGKGFARRDNMNDHIRTHTKEFSHICPMCERGFLGPAKLRKHLKTVHSVEEPEELVKKARQPPSSAFTALVSKGKEPGEVAAEGASVPLPPEPQPPSDGAPDDVRGEEVVEFEGSGSEASAQDDDSDATIEEVQTADSMMQTDPPSLPHSNIMSHAITTAINSRPVSLLNRPAPVNGASQMTELPTQVFIPPEVPCPPTSSTYNTRDMVTLPNELLSMVRGYNS